MKKFLTVLLALSVVFTYTVGTAFAAAGAPVKAQAKTYTLSEVETAIYAQAQKNITQLDTVKANFLANYAENAVTVEGAQLSKAAVEKQIDSIFAAIKAEINKVADQQKDAAVQYIADNKRTLAKATVTDQTTFDSEATASKDGKLYLDAEGTKVAAALGYKEQTYYTCTAAEIVAAAATYVEKASIDTEDKFNALKTDAASVDGKVYADDKGASEAAYDSQTTTYYICTKAAVEAKDATYAPVTVDNATDFATKAGESETSKLYKDNQGATEQNNFEAVVLDYYKVTVEDFPGYFTEEKKKEFEAAINTEYKKYDTADEVKTFIEGTYVTTETNKRALLTAEHAGQKAEIVALIDKIDLTKYSNDVPSDATMSSVYYLKAGTPSGTATEQTEFAEYYYLTAGYHSFQARAKAVIAEANKELAKSDITSATAIATVVSNINAIKDETAFFAPFKTKIDTVKTTQGEAWDKEDLERGQARVTTAMKSHLAEAKSVEYEALSTTIRDLQRKEAAGTTLTTAEKKLLADSQTALAALDKEYVALEEVYASQIKAYNLTKVKTFFDNKGMLVNSVVKAAFPTDAAVKALSVVKLAKVADLKADAATKIASIGIDGQPMYDKAAVEKALEDATAKVYAAATTEDVNKITLDVTPNYNVVKAEMKKVIGKAGDPKLEFNKKFYSAIAQWATTDYDEDKTKEVKAIIADTKAAVRAAKTVAAVDAAFLAGYAKYDAVPTISDRTEAQKTAAFIAKKAEYVKEIGILIDVKATRYDTTKFDADYPATAANYKTELVKGLDDAYSVDELKTIFDEISATINTLKTKADLTAEVKAINDAIGAVKVPATIEVKATVLELNKKIADFKAYAKLISGADTLFESYSFRTSLLASLTADIMKLDDKEIKDAYDAIMKDGKVTLDEKAAVDAFIKLVDTYDDNYTGTLATTYADVYDFDFILLEKAAVEQAIAVIDPNATKFDYDAVKAARAAYDALGEVEISTEMYAKLIVLEKLANEKIITGVNKTTIKISSKAYKGYNKITWSRSKGFKVDGYEVYRSAKNTKNFKKIATYKKQTYCKNTKNLKKGTRYYYKVKGFRTVDGVKVYTKSSIVVNKVAK